MSGSTQPRGSESETTFELDGRRMSGGERDLSKERSDQQQTQDGKHDLGVSMIKKHGFGNTLRPTTSPGSWMRWMRRTLQLIPMPAYQQLGETEKTRDIGYSGGIYDKQRCLVNHIVAHSLLSTPSRTLLLHPHRENDLRQLPPTTSWTVGPVPSSHSTTSQSGKTMKPADTGSLMCTPLHTLSSTWTLVECNNKHERSPPSRGFKSPCNVCTDSWKY
jgi:hypothetical protein